jgi:hypothetical protein
MVRKILSRFTEGRQKEPRFEDKQWSVVEAEAEVPLPSAVTSTEREQSFEFDEEWYLQQNQDVALAVREGRCKSGLAHYTAHGRNEGRPPVPPKTTVLRNRWD